MDVISFILGFVKGKASNSFTDEDLSDALDYINGEQVFTIKYYEGDTLLQTEYKPYGASLSYTPEERDGYIHYWEPKLATVTADAEYHLMWEEKLSFATASWADIARVSEAGRAASHFNIGDTKEVDMTDQFTAGVPTALVSVAIAGFNHDTLSLGGTAGLSIVAMGVSNRHTSTWSTTTTPCAYGGSAVATKLQSIYSSCLPDDLKSVIKSVSKEVDSGPTSKAETLLSNLKLWPLSYTEMGDTSVYGNLNQLGKPYPLFPKSQAFLPGYGVAPVKIVETGANATYWLRQTDQDSSAPLYVDGTASVVMSTGTTINTTTRYIRFGFCV